MDPQPSFIIHDRPVVRPDPAYIATVDLAPFGFYGQMEQIWLHPREGERYEVCCLPFRVYGLAMGDIVLLDANARTVVSIAEFSGNRSLRIFIPYAVPAERFHAAREAVLFAVHDANLMSEWSGERHVAVNISPKQSMAGILEVIRDLDGVVAWEWSDVEEFRANI
ncbi:DUF4265 domain-containing protein [Parafrankia sp. FMc2]|uniref:DUF4265 domain-containing protein n=1 Tax=Parafrankia sp. FMc2 TaxID=3233196 RepID=UPI0034D48241